MGIAVAVFIALCTCDARSQDRGDTPRAQASAPDVASCPGSAPEPGQSAAWSVAFCNRTGHDVVLEFHDNDCPAKDWSHRGDVYQRVLRNGEAKTFPLCYANEPVGKKPAPGVPTLRIPGGKGVVTTWSVVGDCGERSRPLNLDARSFYDRGEYRTGIVLLQHPAGASHCASDGVPPAAGSSGTPAVGAGAGSTASAGGGSTAGAISAPSSAASQPTPPAAPQAPIAAPQAPVAAPPAAPPVAAAAAVNNRGSGTPTLSAVIDPKDVVGRTVRVFAQNGAGYNCTFNLALTFTDGASWNDHGKVVIGAGDANAPITTRKYLKSVSKVEVTSARCTP